MSWHTVVHSARELSYWGDQKLKKMKGTCTLLWMWCTLHTGRELPCMCDKNLKGPIQLAHYFGCGTHYYTLVESCHCMCDKNLKRPIQLAHYFGCGTQYTLSTRGSHTGCG